MMYRASHRRLNLALTLICLCLALVSPAQSQLQPGDSTVMVLPDSSNFVTASLIVASPGKKSVSSMGHSAIRLQCPAHHLDYCYTLENNPDFGLLAFLLGKTPTHDIALPTQEFLKQFIVDGRQIMQHELNLTHHQKQELWRAADIEFTHEGDRMFNYSYNGTDNCTSICLELIESSLLDEKLVVDSVPRILLEDNAAYFRFVSRRSPWVQFVLITLGGTGCDETWELRGRISPELIIPVLRSSHFDGPHGERPALIGDAEELVPGKIDVTPVAMSPTLVFGCLLLLALLITAFQFMGYAAKASKCFDIALFAFQTIIGLFLLIAVFVGTIVGQHWNWYLIPFCPLAIVLWFAFRRRKAVSTIYLLFTIILIIFLLLTPMSSQLDLPHQLITATFAVRTASNYLNVKKIAFNI